MHKLWDPNFYRVNLLDIRGILNENPNASAEICFDEAIHLLRSSIKEPDINSAERWLLKALEHSVGIFNDASLRQAVFLLRHHCPHDAEAIAKRYSIET